MEPIGWLIGLGVLYVIKDLMGKNLETEKNIQQNSNIADDDEIEVKKGKQVYSDPIFKKICNLLNQKKNIFITGGAGTGKSYTLQKLKEYYGIKLCITSTTGISAININGQTIHSWSGIDNDITDLWKTINRIVSNPVLKKQIIECKMLAIDEISMLHSKTLTYLDIVLQKIRGNLQPMGGIQIILIGDFFQLPPVVKNRVCQVEDFCFSSDVWKKLNLETIILKDVKRQSEINYINVLNHIREGNVSENDWEVILERYRNMPANITSDQTKLHLYATNKEADNFNEMCFDSIKAAPRIYKSFDQIEYFDESKKPFYIEKDINKFDTFQKVFDDDFRVLRELKIKVGCRVMLLKNIAVAQGLANGSCGTVMNISDDTITVKFDNGGKVALSRVDFETFRYKKIFIKSENRETFKQRIVRKQFPVRLAYGITIHKSQGMTFNELVIHLDRIFAAGQCYVALSRTTSLTGLNLLGFDPSKIVVNQDVVNFYKEIEGIIKEPQQNKEYSIKSETTYGQKESMIRQAIVNKQKIKIIYQKNQNFGNGEITERIIIPQKIGTGNQFEYDQYPLNPQQIYIRGYCELRHEERTFQLDRIISIETIDC